jgi:hypothetical protein
VDSAPGIVSGIVRDSATRVGLEGVQLFRCGASVGTMSDRAGRFILPSLPPGEHMLCLRRIEYGHSRISLLLAPGAGVAIDVSLPADRSPIQYQRTSIRDRAPAA